MTHISALASTLASLKKNLKQFFTFREFPNIVSITKSNITVRYLLHSLQKLQNNILESHAKFCHIWILLLG